MKKCISIVVLLILTVCTRTWAYTSADLIYAQELADNDIIVNHASNPALYHFSDNISRAELVAIALKLSGTTIPEDSVCQKYFADTTQNDWVCRAVEIAADKGVVSRLNTNFNPQKNISKSEALAILMKALSINVEENSSREGYDQAIEQWQVNIIQSALSKNIISSAQDFGPNRIATRADVFGFAINAAISLLPKETTDTIPTPEMAVSFGADEDSREWVYQYSDANATGFIQEFTPKGETVDNWTELQTHRVDFIPQADLKGFVNIWKKEFLKVDSDATIQISPLRNNSIIVSYSSKDANEKGVAKFLKGNDGVYFILYSTKLENYNVTYFKLWTKIISEAQLIKNPLLSETKG